MIRCPNCQQPITSIYDIQHRCETKWLVSIEEDSLPTFVVVLASNPQAAAAKFLRLHDEGRSSGYTEFALVCVYNATTGQGFTVEMEGIVTVEYYDIATSDSPALSPEQLQMTASGNTDKITVVLPNPSTVALTDDDRELIQRSQANQ